MTGRRPVGPEVHLTSVIEGLHPTAEWLELFLSENPREGLHHEYKSALELSKTDASRTVREYVAAFANSAGGILFFGIADKTCHVEGCTAPGGGTLEEWATRCLIDMAPFLSPPPRIASIPHARGTVLLIATARAPALVPVVQGGRLAYFLRIGDATVCAPEYLISDLMLGHRQAPVLKPSLDLPVMTGGGMTLKVRINNEGLSTARGIVAGIVAFAGPGASPNHPPPSRAILPYIRRDPQKQGALVHDSGVEAVLRPFHSTCLELGPFQHHLGPRMRIPWRAALYILTESSPPTWFQIDYAGVDGVAPLIESVPGSQGPFVGWDVP